MLYVKRLSLKGYDTEDLWEELIFTAIIASSIKWIHTVSYTVKTSRGVSFSNHMVMPPPHKTPMSMRIPSERALRHGSASAEQASRLIFAVTQVEAHNS